MHGIIPAANVQPFMNLADLPAVKYWLDAGRISGAADGATIAASDLRDLSSFRRGALASVANVVYRRNSNTGRPAIEFDGSTSYAVSPSFNLPPPARVLMVIKPLSYNGGRYTDGGATLNRGVIYQNNGGASTAITIYSGGGGNLQDAAHALPASYARLIDASFNNASSTLQHEFNQFKSGDLASSSGFPDGITLGAATGGTFLFSNFQLAELVMLDGSAVPDATLLAIKRQLVRKYAIPQNGNLIVSGSSLSTGTWPATLQSALNASGAARFGLVNYAVAGQTSPVAASHATAHADVWPGVFTQSFCTFDGGVIFNDFITSDPDATTAYNNYVSLLAGREAAGFARPRIVAFTCGFSTALTGAQDTKRQSVNTSIRNNWRSFAGALVDIDADSRLALPGADGTHYDAAQNVVWAELVQRTIMPLINF